MGKPWLPVPDEHRLLAVDRQSGDPGSVLNAYRRFLAWRRASTGRSSVGDLSFVQTPAPVFAFERRRLSDERILCAFNLGNRPASMTLRQVAGVPWTGHGFSADLRNGDVSLPQFGVFFGDAAG